MQAQSDPVDRFSELLTGLFVSGRAHVADASTGECPGDGWGWESYERKTEYGPELRHRAKCARIGWLDGDNLFLEPSATYAELQKLARDQGDSVPVSERTLWKRLIERGLIVSREAPHTTVKRTLSGAGRVRVLHLPSTFYNTGASGAAPVRNDANPCPTPDNAETGVGQVGRQKSRPEQRPTNAPEVSGAARKSGALESVSGTAQAPYAQLAPRTTEVETASAERDDTDLSHLVGATEGEL